MPCGKTSIEGKITQKKKVDGKLLEEIHWFDMPSKFSIHSGNITDLRIKDAKGKYKLTLNWSGLAKEEVELKNGETQSYNFSKTFDQLVNKAKKVELIFSNESGPICKGEIVLLGGD